MTRREARRFYKSRRWRKMRRYVLERDRWRFQSCGLPGSGDVHHRVPLLRDPGLALDPANLVTLCLPCHARADNFSRDGGPSEERLRWLRLTGTI